MTNVSNEQAKAKLLHRLSKSRVNPFITLEKLYGESPDYESWEQRIKGVLENAICERSTALQKLDDKREAMPDWFQQSDMIGYKTYIDRYAGAFDDVADKIPHLKSLSTRYLHLLGVLKCREGLSDGGFAISDYKATNPAYGDINDLSKLANKLRENDICLSVDFVFNHTSDDHPWALKAAVGDKHYQNYYFCFDDRTQPDLAEPHLGEVFPVSSPGNFVFNEQGQFWVWSTFHSFQWDLNYQNPEVFLEVLSALLYLANQGIDIFRMDATAFLWKELGTDCKNHPNTHEILKALRWLLALVAPGCLLKAEAITGARDVKKYFGGRETDIADEAQLSYHAPLMCGLWASLAMQNTQKLVSMINDLGKRPKQSSWITYARCHDDIGWLSLTDEQGADWSMTDDELIFLDQFYSGELQQSFSSGRKFQLDGNQSSFATNGTAASLAGLEIALQANDTKQIDASIDRLLLIYGATYAFSGLPTLFMGEEIGLLNDNQYRSHDFVDDGRYLHRPFYDSGLLKQTQSKGHVLFRLRNSIELIAKVRASLSVMHAENQERMIDVGNAQALTFSRNDNENRFVFVGNFSEEAISVETTAIVTMLKQETVDDVLAGQELDLTPDLQLEPHQFYWLHTTSNQD